MKDRVYGAILGQAIGDALGHPIEFKKTHQVKDLEQVNRFTDDTQMFCAIGEALLEAPPHVDESAFMEALRRHFVEWRKNPLGGNHRAPGGTCMEGVRRLGTGMDWTKTGLLDGKGNGSAMRSGVIGAYYWKNPDYAFRIGCLSSVPTHNNIEPILAAGAVAYLVASAINGVGFDLSLARLFDKMGEFQKPHIVPYYPTEVKFGSARSDQNPWFTIGHIAAGYAYGVSGIPLEDYVKTVGDDFAGVPAVSEAVYFNTRYAEYAPMMLISANYSDDCDTVTAIAGTIAGARFGIDAIPQDWRQRIELSDYLHDLSERIWEASLKPEFPEPEDPNAVWEACLAVDFADGTEAPPVADDLLDFGEVEF